MLRRPSKTTEGVCDLLKWGTPKAHEFFARSIVLRLANICKFFVFSNWYVQKFFFMKIGMWSWQRSFSPDQPVMMLSVWLMNICNLSINRYGWIAHSRSTHSLRPANLRIAECTGILKAYLIIIVKQTLTRMSVGWTKFLWFIIPEHPSLPSSCTHFNAMFLWDMMPPANGCVQVLSHGSRWFACAVRANGLNHDMVITVATTLPMLKHTLP